MIKTIKKSYQGEFKSSQSRFIGILIPTNSKSKFKNHLSQLKKDHPKATHICFAYRIGYQNEEIRANDDGEPSGTAGKPILNQLYSFQLQNVSLFVIRYYGGTKLGVSGLIEAYKEVAFICLSQAEIVETEEEVVVEFELEASQYYEAIKQLKYNKITIVDSSFKGDRYSLKIQIPASKIEWLNSLKSSEY